jgi:protease I
LARSLQSVRETREVAMKVRTLLISSMIVGAGISGCRNDNANPTQPAPQPGRLAGSNENAASSATPAAPTVIGVNTAGVDWNGPLTGVRVAILATDGFEESELVDPRQAYADQGASTVIISPMVGEIQGYKHENKADRVKVDMNIEEADPNQFDALELPGGVMNGDKMRLDTFVTAFVRSFGQKGKPIAAICHGLWPMIEADIVRGRTVTSWPSLKTDLKNAGAKWVDQEVVQDRNFVTSRQPEDIPAFNARAIDLFAKKRPAIGGGPSDD